MKMMMNNHIWVYSIFRCKCVCMFFLVYLYIITYLDWLNMPREVFWSPPSLGSKITSTTCSRGCSPQYNHKFWNSKSSVKRQGVLSVSMSSLILSLLPWSILFVVSGGGRLRSSDGRMRHRPTFVWFGPEPEFMASEVRWMVSWL